MERSATTTMPMSTPLDLFVHELSDAYSAEKIIVGMLGDAQKAATNEELVQGLRTHQKETEQHVRNLEQVFQTLGQQPHAVTCHAAEGLTQSLREGAAQSQSQDVTDGLVTAGGCETEHLEIAMYTGLIKKAQALGKDNVIGVLRQNLQSEQQTLNKLEQIGEQLDAKAGKMTDGMLGQQNQDRSALIQ